MIVVTVPGLRGHVEDHWQTRFAAENPDVVPVPPLGHDNPSLRERVAALQETIETLRDRVILVAHSAGVLTTVHWASRSRNLPGNSPFADSQMGVLPGKFRDLGNVVGALLVTPPVLANELPHGYPSLETLWDNGWLPIPREPLPFPSIVAASTNDALGSEPEVRALAGAWGSRYREIGAVGHLNPASGFGPWPEAQALIQQVMEMQR